jgi:hypothetical protein
MRFNLKIKNLELRSCDESLTSNGEHSTAEIVEWIKDESEKEFCWTLAYWKTDSDGYFLQFVQDRPFGVDSKLFMELAKQGQNLLTEPKTNK